MYDGIQKSHQRGAILANKKIIENEDILNSKEMLRYDVYLMAGRAGEAPQSAAGCAGATSALIR